VTAAPSPASRYLEAQYSRATALRIIYHQLGRQLHQEARNPADYHRLKRRRARVLDHLVLMTGATP
jgi:hypothetical protein